MKNFLWFLAGANRFLLQMCPSDQNRFTKVGLTILITGVFAGITGGYAVYSALGGNLFGAILVGIFWGIAIMNLDSLIVSTIKDSGTFWEKFRVAGVRILLSVFIGLIIARPFELKLFEKEIKDKLVDIELEKCMDRSDLETETTRVQLTDLETETNQMAAKNEAVYAELKCARELLTHERNGIAKVLPCGSSSGKSGNGERFQELVAWVNSLSTEHQQLEQSLKENRNQLAGLRSNVLTAEDGCKQDSISMAVQAAPLSLLEAHQTLHILSEEDSGIQMIVIVVTLLIILLELSPVIVKLMQKPGEYEKLIVEYEQDCRELTYLDLIQKYPFLPARKEYLENFQHNKEIHEKILSEQVAISQLNMNVQHQLDMIKDKQSIEKEHELDVHQQITKDMGRRKLNVAEKISHQWEESAAENINQVPANPEADDVSAPAEQMVAMPMSQSAEYTLPENSQPQVSAFLDQQAPINGAGHFEQQEEEEDLQITDAQPKADENEFVFDEPFAYPFEEPTEKPELPKPPFPLQDKLPINTKAEENATKILKDLKREEHVEKIKTWIDDVERPNRFVENQNLNLAHTNEDDLQELESNPLAAETEDESLENPQFISGDSATEEEVSEDQTIDTTEPSTENEERLNNEWTLLATEEKMKRIKSFIQEEEDRPSPPDTPVFEMEEEAEGEQLAEAVENTQEEEIETNEEPVELIKEDVEEVTGQDDNGLPQPPFPLEDKLPVNTKAADNADKVLADLLNEDFDKEPVFPNNKNSVTKKELHPPVA